jgi:hypothetical protein
MDTPKTISLTLRIGLGPIGLAAAGCPAADGDGLDDSGPGAVADTDPATTTTGPGVTTTPGDAGTTEADGDSSDGGEGGSFIVLGDLGDIPMGCNLFSQDCDEGDKCMPYANDGGPAWNATQCVPIDAAAGQVGDACMMMGSGTSGIDNCDIGLMCWNVDENGVGLCEDMCTGSEDAPICENPDDACSIANGGAIVLCLPECDPLLQDCGEGQACYPIADAFVCAPDASGELGTHGEPCEFINACDAGNVCIGADAFVDCRSGLGCCASVCAVSDIDADAECDALSSGQGCEPWFVEGMAPPGYEDIGVCALPL